MPASWEIPALRSLEGQFCVMNLTAQKDLHTPRAGGFSCLQCSGATGLARSQTRLPTPSIGPEVSTSGCSQLGRSARAPTPKEPDLRGGENKQPCDIVVQTGAISAW